MRTRKSMKEIRNSDPHMYLNCKNSKNSIEREINGNESLFIYKVIIVQKQFIASKKDYICLRSTL